MTVIERWTHDDVLRIMRRLDGGTFGQTTGDTVRAVLHAADAVPASQLRGAVAKINGALAIMEARQSLSGQIPLARDPAAQVLALLRDAAGGQ